MGHPELEDYLDGVNWMVANQQGDARNVGIYGGSYGGFMTFMALLRAPEHVQGRRGAASGDRLDHLQPRVHGQHPQHAGLDPEAYKISSPIEYADKPAGQPADRARHDRRQRVLPGLGAHGAALIELKKDNWELAPYPLERHGFVQPESWYDQYRRIYKLFEAPLAALARELDEELGVALDPSSAVPLGAFSDWAVHETGRRVHAQAWWVQVQGAPEARAEIAELAWVPVDPPHGRRLAPLSEDHILPAAARAFASG
jgi:8-oxo-dGTP pyrophosphatase MutT (NUDIX family)